MTATVNGTRVEACDPRAVEALAAALPAARRGVPLAPLTTFRIGGPAELFVDVTDRATLMEAVQTARTLGVPCFVLAGGSNVLVDDPGLSGLVVHNLSAEVRRGGDGLTVGSGLALSSLLEAAVREALSGLEFAAGIPGSVGGAVYGNAGAYGKSMQDVLVRATLFTPDGRVVEVGPEALGFAYRTSALKTNGHIVLDATFALVPGDSDRIRQAMAEIIHIREAQGRGRGHLVVAARRRIMSQERALLLIADIGGYTAFVRAHRTSLVHAQDVVARLLEAMIDAARGLDLVEVEGDGVFFIGTPPDDARGARLVVDRVGEMYRAFHACRRRIAMLNTCSCHGCREAGDLRVKFVGHVGEIVRQRVKHTVKPGGLDVILVHRMLKNAVPLPEYLLVSDPLFRRTDARVTGPGQELVQEFEGLGEVRTHFVDVQQLAGALPPDPPVTRPAQLVETLGVVARTLPYLLGLRRPHFGLT